MPVGGAVDLEPGPLQQDRQVGRLLQLDDERALADRVREPRGDQHGVARVEVEHVHRAEHRVGVLRPDPAGELVDADVPREPEVHPGGLEHHPRLGLAVREAQVLGRERDVGVGVHGQALAGVEQLDQQRGVGAVRGDVLGPSHATGSASIASRSSRPSGSAVRPTGSCPNTAVVEPTQSSGSWLAAGPVPRSSAIWRPPA